MGFLDKAKKQLTKAVDQHGDKIAQGADKLGEHDQPEDRQQARRQDRQGQGAAEEGLDSLDGKNDDFRKPLHLSPVSRGPAPGTST